MGSASSSTPAICSCGLPVMARTSSGARRTANCTGCRHKSFDNSSIPHVLIDCAAGRNRCQERVIYMFQWTRKQGRPQDMSFTGFLFRSHDTTANQTWPHPRPCAVSTPARSNQVRARRTTIKNASLRPPKWKHPRAAICAEKSSGGCCTRTKRMARA